MAVTRVQEIHSDCLGTCDSSLMRTYQRKFRVLCSDRVNDRQLTAMTAIDPNFNPSDPDHTAIPSMRDSFPGDPLICVSNVQARGVQDDGLEWEVLVDYAYIDPNTNPFTRLPDVSWDYEIIQVPADYDINGKAIVNTAGEPLDPGLLRDVIVNTLNYTRNEISAFAVAYTNTVNSDYFMGYPPKTVKLEVKAQQQTELTVFNASATELVYYSVSYVFKFNPELTWRKKVLNRGFKQLNQGGLFTIFSTNGMPVTQPVLLDNNGKILTSGQTPVFLTFDLDNEMDFNTLGIII